MATITLPPDYFRTAAEKYWSRPTDRKAWLLDQVAKANQSLSEYNSEISDIAQELVKLGAYPSQTWGLTVGATILASIPTGFTQVIGGVLMIGASFFAKAENKAKNQRIANLQKVGQAKVQEAQAVAVYLNRYRFELAVWNWLPFILLGILFFILNKK